MSPRVWLDGVPASARRRERLAPFIDVLLGVDADPLHVARSDMNCDGAVDGLDIQPFVEAMIGR